MPVAMIFLLSENAEIPLSCNPNCIKIVIFIHVEGLKFELRWDDDAIGAYTTTSECFGKSYIILLARLSTNIDILNKSILNLIIPPFIYKIL